MLKTRVESFINKKGRKQLWIAAAVAALVFAAACVVLMGMQKSVPPQNNTRNGVGRLSTDYELSYKPNSLYDLPKPAEKEARLLAYIDHVIWKFSYELTGFEGLAADYEYSADAQLIAKASESSKYIDPDFIVWQKSYPLIAPAKASSDGKTNGLTQQVDVKINDYAEFARSVYEQTQVRTTNELKLTFRVRATVHGPIGDTVDANTVEMVIPMIDSLWVVTGNPVTENKLTMAVAPPKPVANYTAWIVLSGVLTALMLVLVAVLLLGGKQEDATTRFAKTTAKIFKQYGERLVRLENPLPFQHLATIPIDGIEEMIKIADEISQPVFYFKADTVEEKKLEFYVFDSGRIYYLVIFGDMGLLKAE